MFIIYKPSPQVDKDFVFNDVPELFEILYDICDASVVVRTYDMALQVVADALEVDENLHVLQIVAGALYYVGSVYYDAFDGYSGEVGEN